jgi:hypothetical protein
VEGTLDNAEGFPPTETIYTLNNSWEHQDLYNYGGDLYYGGSIDPTPYLRILMETAVENGQYKLYVTLQMVTPA